MAQDSGIERVLLITALVRSDSSAPEVTRDDAMLFARALARAANFCTSSNIKLCTTFFAKNVLTSEHRTSALVKYLLSLAKLFVPRDPEARVNTSKPGDDNEGLGKIVNGKAQQPPQAAFKRLHVLYLVHDMLCYTHIHAPGSAAFGKIQSLATDLVELATCGCTGNATKTRSHVLNLLPYWRQLRIFDAEALEILEKNIDLADRNEWDLILEKLAIKEQKRAQEQRRKKEDETKWIVPQRHGVPNDPSAPWHHLPAANGLYMRRKYGYPLRAAALPSGGFKLAHAGTDAPPDLKQAVSDLYSEVVRCHDKYTSAEDVQDFDALGNIIWKDPERPTRNFWGFSLEAIEKRKQVAKAYAETAVGYDGIVGPSEARGFDGAVARAKALALDRRASGGRGYGYQDPRGEWGGSRW